MKILSTVLVNNSFFYSCKANLIMLKWNLRHLNLDNYFYHYHYCLHFNYNYFEEKFNFTDCPSDFPSEKSAILLHECTAIVPEVKVFIFTCGTYPGRLLVSFVWSDNCNNSMHAGLDTGTSQAKPLEYLGSLCYVFWVVFPVIMIYFSKWS